MTSRDGRRDENWVVNGMMRNQRLQRLVWGLSLLFVLEILAFALR